MGDNAGQLPLQRLYLFGLLAQGVSLGCQHGDLLLQIVDQLCLAVGGVAFSYEVGDLSTQIFQFAKLVLFSHPGPFG